MSKSFKKNNKRLGNSISRTYLLTLKKDLANFQLTVKKKKKKDKIIRQYARLLKLTKQEYQQLFQENKLLKERANLIEKEKLVKKNCKRRPHKVETDSGEEEEQEEEDEAER